MLAPILSALVGKFIYYIVRLFQTKNNGKGHFSACQNFDCRFMLRNYVLRVLSHPCERRNAFGMGVRPCRIEFGQKISSPALMEIMKKEGRQWPSFFGYNVFPPENSTSSGSLYWLMYWRDS
jgi:hypothetical protein